MPSTRVPTSLQQGPGRLPANVVSASALIAPAATPGMEESETAVVAVSATTTLTRISRHMTVLVNFTGISFEVRLPSAPQVGDTVTLVRASGASGKCEVRNTTGTINDSSTSQLLGEPPLASRSFTCVSSALGVTQWVSTWGRSSVVRITAAGHTLIPGPGGADQIILVDSTAGDISLSLPFNSKPGDRVTIIKTGGSTNSVRVQAQAGGSIDGRVSTTLLSDLGALVLMLVGDSPFTWVTVGEIRSVLDVTAPLVLTTLGANANSADEIFLVVRTSNAGWIAGNKTITLPNTTRVGARVTITDADGAAATNNILVSGVLGVSSVSATAQYVLAQNFGSITLVAKSTSEWTILAEAYGLVEDFTSLARADGRIDARVARLQPTPMFNWSERCVALHSEFAGLITNFFPVDGFTAGGTMVLSQVPSPGATGTVGVLRCTVTAGTSGYLHLGSTPTDTMFDPAQLLGFRAILTCQTPNPSSDYDVCVGFGDDISDAVGADGQKLGSNGLYVITGSTGLWSYIRKSGGTNASNNVTAAGTIVAGSRYVLDYYYDGSLWTGHVNGAENLLGGISNTPTAKLNFGLLIINGGGVADYVVDVDSFTIFTRDMGATRHNP